MTTTNTQGAAIARYKIGYYSDDWGMRSSTPSGIPDASGAWVRYEDHIAALASISAAAQQPAPSPAPAGWKLVPVEPTEEMLKAADDGDDAYTLRCFGPGVQRVMQGPYDHYCAMLDAAPTAQADTQLVPVQDEGDDSLLLCASDLQHSAIYDNNVEMQACLRAVADRIKVIHDRAARAPAERLPVNWMAEVERVICRMNSSDPDFDDCADAVALILRLTAEVTGPKGYATWKDAAVAERIRANSVLEDALSDSVRTPLDSLHADAAYLIGRLREGSMPYARVIEIIRERIDAAKAAIRASAAHGQAPAPADSVQEDAARYRWLAASCRSTSEHWGGRWSIIIDGPAPKSHDSEDDFDAAVDAARKQGVSHDR